MTSKKKRLTADPSTERLLFGRIRTDSIRSRAADAARDKRQQRRDKDALRALERARDKYETGSAKWVKAQRAVERYRDDHGL